MNLQEKYRAIKLLEVSRRLYDMDFKPQFRKTARELGTTHPNFIFIWKNRQNIIDIAKCKLKHSELQEIDSEAKMRLNLEFIQLYKQNDISILSNRQTIKRIKDTTDLYLKLTKFK
ncbi:MAG: hypothetical protein U9R23_04510 [Candidatus Cloacimonadota bacterium]|nr:hypothetical protein [Candidatus Cloacimonadota bacterium]